MIQIEKSRISGFIIKGHKMSYQGNNLMFRFNHKFKFHQLVNLRSFNRSKLSNLQSRQHHKQVCHLQSLQHLKVTHLRSHKRPIPKPILINHLNLNNKHEHTLNNKYNNNNKSLKKNKKHY